jgi:predicted transcriptional regulator
LTYDVEHEEEDDVPLIAFIVVSVFPRRRYLVNTITNAAAAAAAAAAGFLSKTINETRRCPSFVFRFCLFVAL